ncbi:Hypothetical predicted protein [Lecanosticta acicola]|uniref:Uncharacterized protein n=1 Tax=Lecanosticta acicola TaxID=111012 RepID=A0AAI8Z5S5_9PEZI|nr:Hypothetical predicted protein [Lecanosticta acicola]
MVSTQKRHHADRPALSRLNAPFRWQVEHLRALLILNEQYPGLSKAAVKTIMWQIFPDMQTRGYGEGHFYDQYQPRWTPSRSSKNWQLVDRPNAFNSSPYTQEELTAFADMNTRVQAAASANNIDLIAAHQLPDFARGQSNTTPQASSLTSALAAPTTAASLYPQASVSRHADEQEDTVKEDNVQTENNASIEEAGKTDTAARDVSAHNPDGMLEGGSDDDEEVIFTISRLGAIEGALDGIFPGDLHPGKLPMFHRCDLTPAGPPDPTTSRFELYPSPRRAETVQAPQDTGIIDPNSNIYKYGGPVVQITVMPGNDKGYERSTAAMICNLEACGTCNSSLGENNQSNTTSPTSGLPFIHSLLDLGKGYHSHAHRKHYYMYDPAPFQSKLQVGVSPYSTYIPAELTRVNVRTHNPIREMAACVAERCEICKKLAGKSKVKAVDGSVTWQ